MLGLQFPGLFFGCSVMRFINHQFMTHDFTTAVLRKGIQVKAVLQATPPNFTCQLQPLDDPLNLPCANTDMHDCSWRN